MPDKDVLRTAVRQMHPTLSDDEIAELIDELEDELQQPLLARALDTGRLPVIAVVIVAILSVVGMLAAAAFYTPGATP